MGTLLLDFRYGIRMLVKNPGFTLVGVLALALGIGATTAIFSVVNAVLLRPLPYPDPERLVRLWENDTQGSLGAQFSVAVGNFLDWRQQNRVFEQMAAFAISPFNLTGDDKPERIMGAYVSPPLFSLLGVSPILGRSFLAEEEQPGKDRVVVLSQSLWQRRFGVTSSLNGRTIKIDGETYTVIGIMPPVFHFPPESSDAQLWVPMAFTAQMLSDRGAHIIQVVARLKPSMSLGQARAEMDTIARRLEQQYPETNKGWRVTLLPLHEQVVGGVRPALLVLLGAVGFVLLIACANVANLLLARAAARQKEMAIRAALGAGRYRVVRQLLTESLLLAVLASVLGLLLALWGLDILVALGPAELPRVQDIRLDARVLGFTLVVSVLTGLIFGLVPALEASNPELHETLKEGGRSSTAGMGRQRLRDSLVVAEVALAFLLLIGAGLLIRSLERLQQVHPGFNPKNLLTMDISLPDSKYSDPHRQVAFFEQLLRHIETLPGVQSAGAVNPYNVLSFTVEGRTPSTRSEQLTGKVRWATPHYFRTMGIPLLRGRGFTERDNEKTPKVILINQTMARRYFGGEDPLGKRMIIGWGVPEWRQIVGVVGDVKYDRLDAEAGDEFYIPHAQVPLTWMRLVVRGTGNLTNMAAALRAAVALLDKELPVSQLRTMEQVIAESVAQPRFRTLLLGVFAALALILAAVGLYGVMTYSVAQRTNEIGIRMALGAERRDVLELVVGQGMTLVLTGVAIGLAAAFAVTRVLSSLLYGVTATDPTTFLAVSLLLAAVALLACYIPARHAAAVDPIVALRYE